mgnify:CR=1 FL=1
MIRTCRHSCGKIKKIQFQIIRLLITVFFYKTPL